MTEHALETVDAQAGQAVSEGIRRIDEAEPPSRSDRAMNKTACAA
jgi:hypothetical protein